MGHVPSKLEIDEKKPVAEIALDGSNRLSLGKLIKGKTVTSFEVFVVDQGYYLKPKVSVPADEAWIFQDPKVRESLQRGLSEEAKHDLGSFAEFVESEE